MSKRKYHQAASIAVLGIALAMGVSNPAFAQDASPAADDPSAGGLEEIVVTAQHRRENLQDVPIAVSAVTANSLAESGVDATDAISQMVPAVQFTRVGPSGLFFLRGVGTTNAAAGEEGANAFYIDGVYISDLGQTINNFNNIERIEVLKGPQGTLFGRNATGGLIHIITRDPGDEPVVKGQIGYANYETVSGQFYAGGPVTENLGWDIAFTGQDQGKGWGRNLTRNTENKLDDHWGLRSKAVFRPSDAVKLTLSGDYYDIKDNTAIGWRLDESGLGTGGAVPPTGHDTTANDPALSHLKIWGVSLTAEADLGFATLTSITAMRNNRNHTYFDVDAGPSGLVQFDYVSNARSYQQEIRLASTDTEPLAWQVGAFYLRSIAKNFQEQRGLAYAPAGRRGQDLDAEMVTDSLAAFAEATYSLTPTTHVTGGLRFTEDRRTLSGTITPISLAGVVGPPVSYPRPGIDPFGPKLKYSEVTYRASIRQDLSDDVNVYASVNRGFKAGSFSLQNLANPPTRPQYIMAYEVGLKSELFERRLRLNLAAYHYDIDDYQVRSVLGGTTLQLNAGQVKVDGLDLEFEAVPTERLRLFGGFTLLNSRFDSFTNSLFYYANPAVCTVAKPGVAPPGVTPGRSTGAPTGGLTECYGDASGNKTPLAPKFSASLGASYAFPVGDEGELRFSTLFSYNGGFYFETDNRLRQNSYSLVNASIEYRVDRHWGLEFWGKNVGDSAYYVQRVSSSTGAYASQAAPRTYGVSVKFDY
jgi:iron complex outermembrane receptor protein